MSIFGSLKSTVAQYADVYIRLFKLNLIDKTSSLLSYVMFALICMFISFCTMLLLAFGIVELFCYMGLTRVASCFITMGVYILFLVIIVAMRKSITGMFAGTFIRIMTEEDKEKDNR
ncbi:MAG: hypothetical protein H7257_13640 [Taibaiella sp.]|nr:hypothetical protein [Taibaiella sp.]